MNKRKAVAIVSEPGKAGVKTHVIDLLSHIDLEKFSITYYYSLYRSDATYRGEIAELEKRGIVCHELPMIDQISPQQDWRAMFQLLNHLRLSPVDILHLHSSKAGALGRIAAFFLWKKPYVIYTPHAMACYRSNFYRRIECILGYFNDLLVAVSASEKQDFIRWHIPKATDAAVVPLGVQLLGNSIETIPRTISASEWLIGGCGRICQQKNALLFFKVAVASIKLGKKWRFKWIGDYGDDDEASAVRQLLEDAGWPDQIEITGWLTEPQAHIQSLDVFCMFSRYESFGYVTAEAMLMNVPVVGTPATGTIDLVKHEVTGMLTEPNEKAIIATILRLENDPVLQQRLKSAAYDFVSKNHTVAKMVTATEQLYARNQKG